ncbi:MAG TPA: hypothetical protein VEV62_10190, partial [Parafilimonas sp.]|nr:hypothetical protein [Parafilimonas sp.]
MSGFLLPGKGIIRLFCNPAYSKSVMYVFVRIILVSVCCSASYLVHAQEVDSARKALQLARTLSGKAAALAELSIDLSASDPDSAFLLAKEGLQLSENIKNDTCIANCFMALGWCYYCLGRRDSAKLFLLQAQSLFHKIKESLREARCLVNLSYVYQDGEEYVELLNCLKTARPYVEKAKDEMGLANIDLTMGSTYGDMQLFEQGKQYIRSAINTVKRLNRTDFLTSCYSAYGYIFMQENNFDSALYYYHVNYAVSKKLGDPQSEAYATDNLGEAFVKKYHQENCNACIDSAFYYYNLALYWFTKLRGEGNIKYEEMNIGGLLRIKKQYTASEKYLTSAFRYFDSTHDVKYIFNTAQELSKIYKDIGDYKKAYTYNLISQQFKDSIDKKNRTDSIAKMFAQYETEKKDRTIQLLNAQARLDKQEISKQHIIELFSVVSVGLAGILFVVLINRNRIKQQLKEVKVRNQLAGD